jgi:hypothetical protein
MNALAERISRAGRRFAECDAIVGTMPSRVTRHRHIGYIGLRGRRSGQDVRIEMTGEGPC